MIVCMAAGGGAELTRSQFFCKFSAQTVTSDIEHRVPDKAALADIARCRSSLEDGTLEGGRK